MNNQFPSRASRREFMRRAGALSLLGGGAPMALKLAAASCAVDAGAFDGYKALVCVFLYGGNDAYNTVLATDQESWDFYNRVRNLGPDPIALPKSSLLQLTALRNPLAQPRLLALHPQLGALQAQFNAGNSPLAIVSNVGPLLQPTTKAQYRDRNHPKPPSLFSHNDQQSIWQSSSPEGAKLGWGGQMADLFKSGNGGHSMFTAISATGNAVWLTGDQVTQYQVSPGGATTIGTGDGKLFGSKDAYDVMLDIMKNARSGHKLEVDHARVVQRSATAAGDLASAMPDAWPDDKLFYTSPLGGPAVLNPLALQLQVVARLIAARRDLGMKRQVFFVSLGGFDTHNKQNAAHADNMARLSHALDYFQTRLGNLGDQPLGSDEQVTTFTASEFGRSFTSNGDGTDHGWGGHHFVMGNAVNGGDIYGLFPEYGEPLGATDFTSPDQINNGSLLPHISVDQYAATLGLWLTGSTQAMHCIFPNLAGLAGKDRLFDLGLFR